MTNMSLGPQIRIIDITEADEYEKYLKRCLVGPMAKGCKRRIEYLKKAIPKGFRKKLLISDGEVVGQIEYSPAEASYYPILGENLIVMNCIWVLGKAKGHEFGKRLMEDMVKGENDASGFATIALENHWSPWFRKEQMEKLGFKPIELIRVRHRTKHREQAKITERRNPLHCTSALSSANV
jgi:N-acetylglutamate synthase-like GNAT family acetyltransferase